MNKEAEAQKIVDSVLSSESSFSMELFCDKFLNFVGPYEGDIDPLEIPVINELFDLCVRYQDPSQSSKQEITREIKEILQNLQRSS